MKFRTRLAVLAVVLAQPAFAQDAQMPLWLEQQLGAALGVEIAAPASASLSGQDRAFQAALARDVSARVDAALAPPVRLGARIARNAAAAELRAQNARRVLYAAK